VYSYERAKISLVVSYGIFSARLRPRDIYLRVEIGKMAVNQFSAWFAMLKLSHEKRNKCKSKQTSRSPVPAHLSL